MRIETVEQRSMAHADLVALHALEAELDAERFPDDPPFPLEEFLADVADEAPDRRVLRVLARDDAGHLLGAGELGYRDAVDDAVIARTNVGVHRQARGRGVARQLLRELVALARAADRSLLHATVLEGSTGARLAEALGARRGRREQCNRLAVRSVPRELLTCWIDTAHDRAGAYLLRHWDGPAPDDLAPALVAARAVMRTAPSDDLTRSDHVPTLEEQRGAEEATRAAGYDWHGVAALAPDGTVAGYSEVFYGPFRPHLAWQGDTAVDPVHRGRGIGRWLKAAMLVHLLDHRPQLETIETWNAASNGPMLRINHALGFRLAAAFVTYEIDTEALASALEAS